MQINDAMVAKALKAYDAAVPEDHGASANGMEAALTAALAEMWRPMAPSDQYVTGIYTHLKGRIPMHVIDDVLRAANAVQTPPKGSDDRPLATIYETALR